MSWSLLLPLRWPVSASHWPNPISSQGAKVAWFVSYSFHFSVYFVFLFYFICGGCQRFFSPRLKHEQLICIVVYSCNGILVNHKNECWDMLQHDEPSKPYAEWKTSALKGHILYDPVIWNIQNGYSHGDRMQIGVARGWGKGKKGRNGWGVFLWNDGNVLELGRGGSCTTL